jgi:hypothetical protein
MAKIRSSISMPFGIVTFLGMSFSSCKKDIMSEQPIQANVDKITANQLTATTSGASYYVDPSSTASTQNGSISAPWKTLAQVNNNMWRFAPGDHIYFKKGQRFKGSLTIYVSGTASAPISFTTYGSGAAPVFEYDLNTSTQVMGRMLIDVAHSQYINLDGFQLTDSGLNPSDHNTKARVATGVNIGNSSFVQVSNMNMSLLGMGVSITGSNNTITHCTMENMRMVINDGSSGNDFGANGVAISGSNNTISYNTFRDLWAPSTDYKYDGGAVEFYGPYSNN